MNQSPGQPPVITLDVPDGESSEYMALRDQIVYHIRFDYQQPINDDPGCHTALIQHQSRLYTVPAGWMRFSQPNEVKPDETSK